MIPPFASLGAWGRTGSLYATLARLGCLKSADTNTRASPTIACSCQLLERLKPARLASGSSVLRLLQARNYRFVIPLMSQGNLDELSISLTPETQEVGF